MAFKMYSRWISIEEKIPPYKDHGHYPYVLAYHTIFEVGVAWFWVDEEAREELEEGFLSKYLCSCHFIKNIQDDNYCIDYDDEIDIFEGNVHFKNLGTITHWMPLPSPPSDSIQDVLKNNDS
jgi:hypothetical protein